MNPNLVHVPIDRRLLVSALGFLNRVDLKGSEALEFGAVVMALRQALDVKAPPGPPKVEPPRAG